ncbi:GNAT family N-acetyltransferase [Parapedobacter sp. ISTM3]|uniref:GNAT family N-acetyltransferase n=1 Tax=Parapedobacter sp. ISTM3 TaxID=2800130 RepID=UPI001902F36E|nr:GNAT family N-acetyltransferase [Parapedobacter sp. ISTM3]MBK1438460.1 GNAT family N-acetyltransferase [Parapedobacter sp. ISTM3]
MHIKEVTSNTPGLREAMARFLRQLTGRERVFDEADLEALIASENSHLFVAVADDGNFAGMITVCIYRAPTGRKAWVEDVVVDEAYRGQGLGRRLTEHAIAFAKAQEVDLLSLTSNPTRIEANKLYPSVGFSRKETNVYVMTFESSR